MRTRRSHLFLAAALTGLLLAPTAASAQSDVTTVTVVHGIPDRVMDVWLDGEILLEDFAPASITEPLEVPAGDHQVAVTEPAPDDADASPVDPLDVTLEAGANVSLVAQVTDEGDFRVASFTNDVSTVPAGQARVTVRHVSAAGTADVLVDGEPAIEGLEAGAEAVAEVPAGEHDFAVNAAGTDDQLLAMDATEVADGTNTIVYAVGNPANDTFEPLVQTISGLQEAPAAVPAGNAGLVDDGGPTALVLGLLAVAAVALLARHRLDPAAR